MDVSDRQCSRHPVGKEFTRLEQKFKIHLNSTSLVNLLYRERIALLINYLMNKHTALSATLFKSGNYGIENFIPIT